MDRPEVVGVYTSTYELDFLSQKSPNSHFSRCPNERELGAQHYHNSFFDKTLFAAVSLFAVAAGPINCDKMSKIKVQIQFCGGCGMFNFYCCV